MLSNIQVKEVMQKKSIEINHQTNINKAIFYDKCLIAQIVTDVVNLENINYIVPEMHTLLDGITVGGHKLQDELITPNDKYTSKMSG